MTDVEKLLDEVTEDLKAEASSQIASHAMEAEADPKMDRATILRSTTAKFESSWADRDFRLARSPAKIVLAGLNRRLQSSGTPRRRR